MIETMKKIISTFGVMITVMAFFDEFPMLKALPKALPNFLIH